MNSTSALLELPVELHAAVRFGKSEVSIKAKRASRAFCVNVEHRHLEPRCDCRLERASEEGRSNPALTERARNSHEVNVGRTEPLRRKVFLVDFAQHESGDLAVGCNCQKREVRAKRRTSDNLVPVLLCRWLAAPVIAKRIIACEPHRFGLGRVKLHDVEAGNFLRDDGL